MRWGLVFLAFVVLTAPNLFALQPVTYPLIHLAQLAALLLALLLMVLWGRASVRVRPAFWWGAAASAAATLASAVILRLPAAERALAANLPGVPPAAVTTMLAVHWQVSALLSALLNGILFGLAAVYLAWWGHRTRRPVSSS